MSALSVVTAITWRLSSATEDGAKGRTMLASAVFILAQELQFMMKYENHESNWSLVCHINKRRVTGVSECLVIWGTNYSSFVGDIQIQQVLGRDKQELYDHEET